MAIEVRDGRSTESGAAIVKQVREMLRWREEESQRLLKIHLYAHGRQAHPLLPSGAPTELTRLSAMSRVNLMKIVVNSVTQCLFVDGYRKNLEAVDAPVWEIWQRNKMNKAQIGVHRAALTYGTSYATVLPGSTAPAIRGYSPRRMTTIYGEDEDWPIMALRTDASGDGWMFRLYDEDAVHLVSGKTFTEVDSAELEYLGSTPHGLGVTPVVRFLNEVDLDEDNEGEVEPLFDLQDQVDLTTFGLLVAQHFAAFRQRYIMGWTAESERELLKVGVSKIMTFEDPDVKVGEFGQTELGDYLKSREESLKQAASISQTPVHELIGSLVNLSAEALVASEAGQRRKVTERQTSFGESWEQVFELAAKAGKIERSEKAEVRWRDTEDRSLAATVDALGKLATQLSIPPQELWERIPGVTQQQLDRWKKAFDEQGGINALAGMLDRQRTPRGEGEEDDEAAA